MEIKQAKMLYTVIKKLLRNEILTPEETRFLGAFLDILEKEIKNEKQQR